jgi:hypothetical protein
MRFIVEDAFFGEAPYKIVEIRYLVRKDIELSLGQLIFRDL